MTGKKVDRFVSSPSASPTYLCGACGKRTRETGLDESSVELCRRCYLDAVCENRHSDNAHRGMWEECEDCAAYRAKLDR